LRPNGDLRGEETPLHAARPDRSELRRPALLAQYGVGFEYVRNLWSLSISRENGGMSPP
jgi:hypothetical protein